MIVGGVIAFSILAAIDLVILFFMLRYVRRKNASQAWPETVGIISVGHISLNYDSNDNSIYIANFAFTYKVPGSVLTGNFQIKNMMRSQGFAARAIADHPVGTTLSVRYNPEKPQEYFTEFDNISVEFWIYFIFFFLLLIIFSYIFFLYH